MIPTMRRDGAAVGGWGDAMRLRRDMNDLLDSFGWRGTGENAIWAPPVNVREDGSSVYVEMEVPGVDPDAVEISIEDRLLRIAGEKRQEVERESETFHVLERRYGRFERSFTLGRAVDPEAIEASYDAGVLTVRLPKPEEARPRRIQVKAGAGNGGGAGRQIAGE
jgi:HSP20 family protein